MKELTDEITRNLNKRTMENEAIRVFHGRGGCFSILPNINIDYFPPAVVIMQYRDDETSQEDVVQAIKGLFPEKVSIFWQKRFLPRASWELKQGEPIETTHVKEGDALYKISFLKNQNMGLFLDMKEGRRLVSKISSQKNVLNLFSYTCPFSVVSLLSGADQVVNMDMSKGVLSTGRENHQLNKLDLNKVKFLSHDIFKSFGKLKKNGPFGLVIIDPPSDQGKSFSLDKNYAKLLRRLPDFIDDNAEVILCLNSPFYNSQYLIDLVKIECPRLSLQEIYYSPDEFREIDKEKGVKILHFRYI